MGFLALIIVPIIIYWIKVGAKYNRNEGSSGQKRYLIQLVLMLLFITVIWWFLFPNLSAEKAIYAQPKGLLLYVLTVIVSMGWPIIMEIRLDRRIKKEVEQRAHNNI